MSFSNSSSAGRKPRVKTHADPKPAAVLSAFKLGTWGQPGEAAKAKTKATAAMAPRLKPTRRAKVGANRKSRGKTVTRDPQIRPQVKGGEKGQKSETHRQVMAHENNPMQPTSGPGPLGSKEAPSGTPGGRSRRAAAPGAIPSARLSRMGGNDRGNGPPPNTGAVPATQPHESAIAGGLPGPSNEEFQSWIARVRILNQNEAQQGDGDPQSKDAKPLDETKTAEDENSGHFFQAASPLDTSATPRPIAADPPAKVVQSSRDWSETAKKALDEMLVTLPEEKPAGWSAPYARQSPIAPPPVKTVMPLYAKVLLPVMGLALSAYPLYFAAQKGWLPDLFGDAPIEIASQGRVAGQTPAPLSNRSRSTTDTGRSGFELAGRAPSAPRVALAPRVAAAAPQLPAPLTPPTRARATLLPPEAVRPATQAKAVQPSGVQTPAAPTGWTTRVTGANSASVPISIENVVAVGPTAAPARQVKIAPARPVLAAPPPRTVTARAAARNANRFANNSVELPNEIRSVGGPVVVLQPNSPSIPSGVATADPLTGKASPDRLASLTPVEPIAVNPVQPALPRQAKRAATVENTQALLTRGTDLLKLGDVVSARLFFELAAKAGDPTGALAAGRTYDPLYLSRLGVRGIKADPRQALTWYRTARQGGNTASAADILRLESQAGR